jgi:hypothetical protein
MLPLQPVLPIPHFRDVEHYAKDRVSSVFLFTSSEIGKGTGVQDLRVQNLIRESKHGRSFEELEG